MSSASRSGLRLRLVGLLVDAEIVLICCRRMRVSVLEDPPPVIVRADNVSVAAGEVAQLACVVQSSVEFNVSWIRVTDGQTSIIFHNGSAAIIRSWLLHSLCSDIVQTS